MRWEDLGYLLLRAAVVWLLCWLGTWHDTRRERKERNERTQCKTTIKKDSQKDRYKNGKNSKYDVVTNISTWFLPLISIRSSNCISWFVTGHVFVRSKCFSINLFSNNKPVFLEITPCVGTSPETTSHNNKEQDKFISEWNPSLNMHF